MPVRKVASRGGNVIGHFPSLKIHRMVMFESLIERDYLYLLDYEPSIVWFEEQPLTIAYESEGQCGHYTPDFHIVEATGDTLIECKPQVFVSHRKNQPKFAAARAWCLAHGWNFRIVTDQELRSGFRLENIKLLTRYARHRVAPDIKGKIYAVLYAAPAGIPIAALAQQVSSSALAAATAAILCMAFHHEVFIALEAAALQKDTCVYLSFCPSAKEHR